MSVNTDMIIDGGGSVGNFNQNLDKLLANQAADERRAATATGKKQDEIMERIDRRQAKIDAAQTPTTPTAPTGPTSVTPTVPVGPTATAPSAAPTYVAPDGTVFTDANAYVSYLTLLAGDRAETARKEEEKRLREEETGFRRQSAFEVLRERFTSFGLPTIAAEIEKIFKGEGRTRLGGSPIPIPTSEAGFYLALDETDANFKRFGKVNEDRIKSGYTALDEKTILAMEDEYQKVMKSYGTPAGFYDTPEDFQAFLANDLSEVEVADRLQASRQFAQVVDPGIKMQLKSLYNIDENMLTAYIADPAKGQSLLTGLANKSLTGAAAILQGITAEAAAVAQGFGAGEMRFQEQQQRFGLAASGAERGTFLSRIDQAEKEFGQKEAVEITFGGLEQSVRAAEKLASRERARFTGRSGITTASLATPTAGQY
jgi:hypothetical protein